MDSMIKKDLYEFLGVQETATESEIKKAFRQKALICHPDKNPDDVKAAQDFRDLTKCCEILLDTEARKAYDKIYKSRKDRIARNKTLDAGRKKLKDDLEARERAAREGVEQELDSAVKLAQEIERIRKQGSLLLEKENEIIRKQIEKEKMASMTTGCMVSNETNDSKETRVKVSWKKGTSVDMNKVRSLFERFGQIQDFIVSSKGTSVLIVYPDAASAVKAHSSPLVSGFTITILDPLPLNVFQQVLDKRCSSPSSSLVDNKPTTGYEESVLEKMRRKAREKKLLQQEKEAS